MQTNEFLARLCASAPWREIVIDCAAFFGDATLVDAGPGECPKKAAEEEEIAEC
jgi:hypothetical protein